MKLYKSLAMLLLCLLGITAVHARPPMVAIIIDDLGYRLQQDMQAMSLDGPLAFAVLPHAPNVPRVITTAKTQWL